LRFVVMRAAAKRLKRRGGKPRKSQRVEGNITAVTDAAARASSWRALPNQVGGPGIRQSILLSQARGLGRRKTGGDLRGRSRK
jgi:hypothetical protein